MQLSATAGNPKDSRSFLDSGNLDYLFLGRLRFLIGPRKLGSFFLDEMTIGRIQRAPNCGRPVGLVEGVKYSLGGE